MTESAEITRIEATVLRIETKLDASLVRIEEKIDVLGNRVTAIETRDNTLLKVASDLKANRRWMIGVVATLTVAVLGLVIHATGFHF